MIVAFSSLIVPMFDAVRVSLHRIRKHRNPFLPDRNHIHHKLIRAGIKRTAHVLATILGIDLFFICFNALLADEMNVTLLIIIDIIIYTSMHLVINHFIRKNGGGPSYIPVEELAKTEPELARELGLDRPASDSQDGYDDSTSAVIQGDNRESTPAVILDGSEESETQHNNRA